MKQRTRIWLFAIGAALLLAIWIRWIGSEAQLYQSEYGPQLRREFEFGTGSPYVLAGEDRIEVFSIYPIDGGALYAAGFRDGDIVISEEITGFYKLIYSSRGKSVSIEVVDGGDGPPLAERKIRTLTLEVPIK